MSRRSQSGVSRRARLVLSLIEIDSKRGEFTEISGEPGKGSLVVVLFVFVLPRPVLSELRIIVQSTSCCPTEWPVPALSLRCVLLETTRYFRPHWLCLEEVSGFLEIATLASPDKSGFVLRGTAACRPAPAESVGSIDA